MSEEELLKYLRKHTLIIGDFMIIYNGEKIDTITGKTESWTIIKKLPIIEELGDKENE